MDNAGHNAQKFVATNHAPMILLFQIMLTHAHAILVYHQNVGKELFASLTGIANAKMVSLVTPTRNARGQRNT